MKIFQNKHNSNRIILNFVIFVQSIHAIVIIQINQIQMGPRHSKDTQLNFMKDYEIIQQNTSQNITFLQHKKTQQQYLLKEFNFNDKRQCQKTMEKLAELKTKLANNKHVVPLKDYLMTSQDQYCSTFYKIYALFEYPQRTLDDQINQRKLHHKKFTETQLWSILASCIVGLSHLQKNGIKHSALKSNNIIISRQGIIKVSDPFAMGQLPNYDAALTKRSIQHVYLSPEQCQALQQQLINPNYNPFKSDIWTLGMIMLEAGLLQYQDQQCYRDDKSRIHWETVQYNIDRLGQAYSDEIKNMVEFMLSRDERARPDWIDLQAHVMKGGDDVRRSFIQEQTKVEGGSGNTFINSDSYIGSNQQQQPIGLNKRQTTNTNQIVQNQLPSQQVPSLPINRPSQSSDVMAGQFTPRNPGVVSYQNPPQQYYPRPQSPRVSQPTQVYHHHPGISHLSSYGSQQQPGSVIIPTMVNAPPPNYHHVINQPVSSYPLAGVSVPGSNTLTNVTMISPSQSPPNIMPLKPSNIQHSRPNRNIFPSDTYVTKTKFDENLIIMVDDDEQGEQNQPQVPISNTNTNTKYNSQDNRIVNRYQPQPQSHAQVHYINNTNKSGQSYPLQPQRYSSYSSPGQSDTYNTNQNRMMRPFTTTTNTTNTANINNNMHSNGDNLMYQQPPQQRTIPNTSTVTGVRQPSGGQLQYVIQQFKMGSRYEGNKLNGLRHGYGKFYYQDGGMYDGEWRQNKMEGNGKLYYQSSKLAYDGNWKNDQFMGKGVLYNQVPQILNKTFNYNDFDEVDEYWTKYQGQFADDMKNGRGILYLSNGEKFQGNFVADNVQGPGVFYTRNGQRITGNWVDNRKVG